ncbi:exodeoxyribonuclease V subunit beta [Telluria aromaticivorans]|uniref:RecBCD enzyme subunit RecB n=1 Tax=Telluria aromaticivorans TaxID=2725995 RepID=A0A7Y2JWJ6_9BURK|nr:exodeoxyribonuclease V subunit beta [Telluria aromaticivorans]NNG21895.1 exodeoxyribonuclease V subunit beta [Telluria aromaticivorans]
MSQHLDPLDFPLHGSRLIEASAGTGKTWTIAALYLRLVLGHGGEAAFVRPLLPSEILVMTFTRAATRELANRVRERLVEAAAYFRGQLDKNDPYLRELAGAYPGEAERNVAAHRLVLAAETMDEAAIFTIDAWCQRMLREHAFDSGSLFDEELVTDERALFEDAAHDYWRQHIYPLNANLLGSVLGCWKDVDALKSSVRELVSRTHLLGECAQEPLGSLVARIERALRAELVQLKDGWAARADEMEAWIAGHRERQPKCFNGNKMRADSLVKWFEALRAWAADPAMVLPALNDTAWKRLCPDGIVDAFSKDFVAEVPDCFGFTAPLKDALEALDPLSHALLRHAASHIGGRMRELKARNRQFGFADMLERLKAALEGPNGEALRMRIVLQFPVAMVDEFQDTSPDQYRIFDLLYRVAANDPQQGLFLIGDPKQSIYGFRGADIHSYLSARRATEGRHYQLGTNYRSTSQLVEAVNQLFRHAEGHEAHAGYPGGAFRFRRGEDNPLPFEAVAAQGHRERLVGADGPSHAMSLCCAAQMSQEEYREFFAHHCAEHIVGLLGDERVGFLEGERFRRLMPADVAILVRDRREAAAVRRALVQRKVASVYLSDKDSVVESEEAADVLRWLYAVANPLDGTLARAAFATRTAGLALGELARLSSDEMAWEGRVEQLKALHGTWQRQGVLAMLRRFVHELGLPARLLREAGGERRLTNLLHLAELLQEASTQLEGEQALIRWLAEQLEGVGEGGDERVLRLESDAELVKVVTVHKSKGLEYPLVYLPFAVTARRTDRRNRAFFEFVGEDGARRLDLSMGDEALEAVDRARLEEDLRLLYVALTRARHFLWLGAAPISGRSKSDNRLHESALGYLLGGGDKIDGELLRERLERLRGGVDGIVLHDLSEPQGRTPLVREDVRPDLLAAPRYEARFERDWSIGSFTSLVRHAVAAPVPTPMRAQEETLREEEPSAPTPPRIEDAPWHRFPRGSVPGNFMHEQLEWMAQEGFERAGEPEFMQRLAQRIERAGWGHRQEDALSWLHAVVNTPLPPVGAALCELVDPVPELEFWFPSERLDVARLDRLCRARIMKGIDRPTLPDRTLHGMLKGFADLVFEHEGRFWVLDYKTNALGPGDAAYTQAAMELGMAGHRYDIQATIYLLALHRLLRSRLGDAYEPRKQLGGAVFLFLRGIANPDTRGCCVLAPDLELLDDLEALLDEDRVKDEHGEA